MVGSGEIATEALEPGAVVGGDMDLGVELESGVAPRTQVLAARFVVRGLWLVGGRPDDLVIRWQRRAFPPGPANAGAGGSAEGAGVRTTSSWWGWASSSSSEALARRASSRPTRASTRPTISSTSPSFGGASRTKRTAPVSATVKHPLWRDDVRVRVEPGTTKRP